MAKGLKSSGNPLYNFDADTMGDNLAVEKWESDGLREVKELELVSIQQEPTLNQKVKKVLNKVNEFTISENSRKKFSPNSKKFKHSDIFMGVTIAIRRDYSDLIETIWKNSSIDKYQIIDMIIQSGLENIDFDG